MDRLFVFLLFICAARVALSQNCDPNELVEYLQIGADTDPDCFLLLQDPDNVTPEQLPAVSLVCA